MDPRYRLHLSWPSARRSAIYEKVTFCFVSLVLLVAIAILYSHEEGVNRGEATVALMIVGFCLLVAGTDGTWKIWELDIKQRAFLDIRIDFAEADRLLAGNGETAEQYLEKRAAAQIMVEEKIDLNFGGKKLTLSHNEMLWYRDRDLFVRCGLIKPSDKVAHLLDDST